LNRLATFSVGELAEKIGAAVIGDPATEVNHIAPVESAGPCSITFITGRKYLNALGQADPGAVVLSAALQDETDLVRLVCDDPYLSYAKLTQIWAERLSHTSERGVHRTAVVSPKAQLADDVCVGANTVIEPSAVIEDGATIGPGSFIGAGSRVGGHTTIHPNVTILADVTVGQRCEIHSGAVIGADGFGWAPGQGGWEKICQLGGVRIGDRVSIGACTTVDRGAIEDTVLEDGVILDNHIQVAHNVFIGENTAIAGCTGIAGSTRIGRYCRIGGAVSIVGHIAICDRVTITANSFVNRSIREAGSYSSGYPVEASKTWRKNAVRLQRLDQIARQVFHKSFTRR
jgi:UDP-3-O-[3-hydroxymyristoyl] glucosamine N-acyltransferase